MADLESCPFCDAEPTHASRPTDGVHSVHWIECEECGMRGPQSPSDDMARRLWSALPRVSSSEPRPAEHDKRRDYFAAQAMREMIASGRYDASGFPDSLAMDAWRVADAMVEHREGVGDGEA